MLAAPRDPLLLIDGDDWWIERRLLARKLLDQNDAATAYRLCAEHSATSHEMKIEAEFHAGWIALRFLNDPGRARRSILPRSPSSPRRRCRVRGRPIGRAVPPRRPSAADALVAATRAFYEEGGEYHAAAYYGQLARGETWACDFADPHDCQMRPRGDERDDSIKVVELLLRRRRKGPGRFRLSSRPRATLPTKAKWRLLRASWPGSTTRSFPSTSARSSASAACRSIRWPFRDYGVPPFEPLQNSAGPSVVYSVARQESAFNTTAVSSAGAKGLMQMILSTAKRTAQRAGVAFDARSAPHRRAPSTRNSRRVISASFMAEQKRLLYPDLRRL